MSEKTITKDTLILDPVHQFEDKWWFWDQTWANREGPYETEQDARNMLLEYSNTILGESSV